MNPPAFLLPLISAAAVVTGRNPEVVHAMSAAERGRVVVEAAMLVALATLVFVQWLSLLANDSPVVAVPGALVFTVLIIGFDYVVGMALERAFAEEDAPHNRRLILGVRVAMASVFAAVLSTAFVLKQFAPAIDEQNRRTAELANAPLRAEFAARAQQIRRDHLAPIEAEITEKSAMRDKAAARVDIFVASAADALSSSNLQNAEALRQQEGVHGAQTGRGPLYRYAVAQALTARSAAEESEKSAQTERAAVAALGGELRALRDKHGRAITQVSRMEAALGDELQRDPRYSRFGTDFLSRLKGLIRMMKSPEDGMPILLTIVGLLFVFISLETAYLLAKSNHQGMTYALRDRMREQRDLEAWSRRILADIHHLPPMPMPPTAGRGASNDEVRMADATIVPLRPATGRDAAAGE